MQSLNDEYVVKERIYKQQKEYRQTPEGKLALRRAKERQILKNLPTLYCKECNEVEFEVLTLVNDKTLCYNCKYRRQKVLEECELCQ